MGASLSSVIIVTSIAYSSTYAETIVCVKANGYCECDTVISGEPCTLDCRTEAKNCMGDPLVCRDNDDCTIVCGATDRGCQGATITCPANANCIVDCRGVANSCNNLITNVYNAANYTCLGGTNCAYNKYQINTNAPTTANPTAIVSPTSNPITYIPTTSNPTTNTPTTNNPTIQIPSISPNTMQPTHTPTNNPTNAPSIAPSITPTPAPTTIPSQAPTDKGETKHPAIDPTQSPTKTLTISPTSMPTISPLTVQPTVSPATENPTSYPTIKPTNSRVISMKYMTTLTLLNNANVTSSILMTNEPISTAVIIVILLVIICGFIIICAYFYNKHTTQKKMMKRQGLSFAQIASKPAIKSVIMSGNNKDEIQVEGPLKTFRHMDENIVKEINQNINHTTGVVDHDDMDVVETVNATQILMEYMDEGETLHC